MKLYPTKKLVEPTKSISNSIRNSLKLSSPKEISINMQSTPTPPNHSNGSGQNDQKENEVEQKNNYFSLEDEYRLKYVEKCLMKALRSGNKLNDYQLKVNSEIIKKLKSAVQSKSKQNKQKEKYNLIIGNRKSLSTKENKQNEQRLSNEHDSQMENRSALKHRNIRELQNKQKKKSAIKQNYYTHYKAPQQSIKINNYCKIYEQNYLESISSNESQGQCDYKRSPLNQIQTQRQRKPKQVQQEKNIRLQQQISQKKLNEEQKMEKQQKYYKRTLRTNENYLIKANQQSLKGNNRRGHKNKQVLYSEENERNVSQNQSFGSRESQISKRIIKINNKPHVIIMKTINNNYNCKENKTQSKANWDSTSQAINPSKNKNSIKSFSVSHRKSTQLNQENIRKTEHTIENNQDRIKQISEDISKLKEQCQRKDSELLKYYEQTKRLKTQNEDLLKIHSNKQQIRLDLKLSLKCLQTPNEKAMELSLTQREKINCGQCERSQQNAKYLSQKVLDLQMMLISQNNQIQNLRQSLSEYMLEPKNSHIESGYSKSKQTFCSSAKQKQHEDP